MFEERRCPACGRTVKKGFSYCPYCGAELFERQKIHSIFEDIDKEFKRIDKIFSSEFFKLPEFKMPKIRGGGISISIQSGSGMEPKIEVKTSGEYKKFEPEIKRKLGIKPGVEEVEEKKIKKIKVPKVTEEPKAEVETVGKKKIIKIELPDVKSEDNIEVRDLEQSIEVKAFAGDKAYFKLFPLVGNVIKKEFKNGVLRIEVE